MDYELYNTTEGPVKVYRDAGYEYYLDVDNKYDMTFDNKASYDNWMKSIDASFVGYDHD